MKTKTLLQLARQNNRTLAYLSRTWAKICKCVDPVKAAVEIAEARFWAVTVTLCWFIISAVLFVMTTDVNQKFLICFFTAIYIFGLFVFAIAIYEKWTENVRDFLKAITLLEGNLGSFNEETSGALGKWHVDRQEFSSDTYQCKTLVDAATAILRGSAGDVLVLEGIGWHDGRRKELRDEFSRKLPLMNQLLGTGFKAGDFLKSNA